MEELLDIPDYVRNIKSMHFTKAGEAEAAAYGQRVIWLADLKMLKASKVINNKAAYFFKLCNLICGDLNVEPDYAFAARLHEIQRTNSGMPKLVSEGKNPNYSTLVQIPKREGLTALQAGGSSATSLSLSASRSSEPISFNCPCAYRKKLNPEYICYGTRCAFKN